MLIEKIARINRRLLNTGKVNLFPRESNADKVSEIIYNELVSEKPTMIARYGATELACIINYLGIKNGKPNMVKYLLGGEPDWWWHNNVLEQMKNWSGFFPPTISNAERFCQLMLEDSKELDILACWQNNERKLEKYIGARYFIQGLFLDPFWSSRPWTRALAGKKILVIHPFAELIREQYQDKREYLFTNSEILPEFELHTITAVQSLGGESSGFTDWFSALKWMEDETAHHDFDIALIGCGAYGFPLAAHIKRMGKKAVHIGGPLQLLFGIIGRRWENPSYGVKELKETGRYSSLINEYWVRPGEKGRPRNAGQIEDACYW